LPDNAAAGNRTHDLPIASSGSDGSDDNDDDDDECLLRYLLFDVG